MSPDVALIDRLAPELSSRWDRAKRQRIRFLGTQYDRARDLPAIAPSFALDWRNPRLSGLRPGARNNTCATTMAIYADLAYRRRNLRAIGESPRLDAICAAMVGEALIFRRQRRAAIAEALAKAGYRAAE